MNYENSNRKAQTENLPENEKKKGRPAKIRWQLLAYDSLIYIATALLLLWGYNHLPWDQLLAHTALGLFCTLASRILLLAYRQIWRYGGTQAYIRMIVADGVAFAFYFPLSRIIPMKDIFFALGLSVACVNLLLTMAIRMLYHYAYQYSEFGNTRGAVLRKLLLIFAGMKVTTDKEIDERRKNKIKIAIVGAGRVGVMLAEELVSNPRAAYIPCCFIDTNEEKSGRMICGYPVVAEKDATREKLDRLGVQEVVLALPQLEADKKRALYEYYKSMNRKVKVYDYPVMQTAGKRRHLREFDIEELLFRKAVDFSNDTTSAYYKDKVIMITGGGGSIGSELCRQLAKMQPKRLVVLDICENGAYDVQQELKIAYGKDLDLQVEIVSVCDRKGLELVFNRHRPQIVLNAAAHKHVPLMEHNCCEAVKNNVFGTLNTVELSEKYGAERFIMVSTDKAVNPTNVMGATKRMCEMIVQSHSRNSAFTVFSATRFGNVLGSAGSVIPLFKRQIKNGGPITVTDKRIIRYFMTIPEAAQLVLQSGAMAKNGELFVLDMGKPIKILELAENMIRLAGLEPYSDIDIIETGLRPGEKLYEELLIKSEELDKTENSMIFIERDTPLTGAEIARKLKMLDDAVATGDDNHVREVLKVAVPTFKAPEEINIDAGKSQEMQMAVNG
jgi:FlaA1/EpsC-like NDP-sugar epimerase